MKTHELRHLNFDDLFLLKHLALGLSLTQAAKELHLSQPALSQRIKKMEAVFGCQIIRKAGRNILFTKEGELLARKAIEALSVMGSGQVESTKTVTVNVGTRPEVGRSWLWPALQNLAHKNSKNIYHLSFGSGEEILANLGARRLDVVLTSAPLTTKEYAAIDVAEERYVLVTSSKLAKRIENKEDLKQMVLIEHDRSFPFQRYLPTPIRTQLQFSDVWFLESTEIMIQAIATGFGVGIVPEYLFLKHQKTSKLQMILSDIKLSSDNFRLIYRKERGIEMQVQDLAVELKSIGLM